VFSPYYAWSRGKGKNDPEDHCALNVALYGEGANRWAMTERGHGAVQRSASEYRIGQSRLAWRNNGLLVDIDEIAVPLPRRIRGRVKLTTPAVCNFITNLDVAGRHHWGPIAPCARVEVELQNPKLHWSGHAYMDANQGSEPIENAFHEWDWSRAEMADGSTSVIYDVREKAHSSGQQDRVIAERFKPDGSYTAFSAPPRQAVPTSAWRIARTMRSDVGVAPQLVKSLEDTPFYARSLLKASVMGEPVTAMHETLNVPRVVSTPVRLMLPWRMPRRA
jgi:carotenoid 1,2-hydratase